MARRPIKIFYIIGTLEIGGAEGQLVQLATRLDRERFEPVVCCLTAGGPYRTSLEAAGVPVEVLGFRGFRQVLQHPPQVAAQLVRLLRTIRRWQPDIVHGFLFWAYVLGAYAARLSGVPVVLTSRRSLGIYKAAKLHYLILERVANRMTDLVIANSEAVRQDVLRQERLPARKVIVIPNGLDPERFRVAPDEALRHTLGLDHRGPVVGVLANFARHYKGHQYFLQAWAKVAREYPAAVALIIGDGPLRPRYEAAVAAEGLSESVRFLGLRLDVPALLALTNLVVHPSLEEGFSNAILEAMAAGKPVVASAVGGNPEAVFHGETGLLVPPRDAIALAEAMRWCFRYPAAAARFGTAGRQRVAERFTLIAMIRQYEAIYEQLVRTKTVARAPAAPEQEGAVRVP